MKRSPAPGSIDEPLAGTVVLIALCLALTACAGGGGEPSGHSVMHSVAWAPNGRLLAFVVYDGAYVVSPGGSGLQRVVDGDADEPTWAPNGRELALVVRERRDYPTVGPGEITLVRLAPLGLRNLSRSPADDAEPAWSPNGERVVFSSNRTGHYDLYSVGRDGRGLRRLTRDPARESAPAWSPDGRTIVFRIEGGSRVPFSGGSEFIVQISADGGSERVLVSMAPRENLNGCCWRPRWSPDGRLIAFDLGARISVLDVGSGRSRVLARGTDPHWSPDSTRILFQGWEPDDCADAVGLCIGSRVTGLWVVTADGRRQFSLARRAKLPSVVTVGSSWAPDGKRIAFVLDVNGGRSIALVNPAGSDFRRLRLVDDETG